MYLLSELFLWRSRSQQWSKTATVKWGQEGNPRGDHGALPQPAAAGPGGSPRHGRRTQPGRWGQTVVPPNQHALAAPPRKALEAWATEAQGSGGGGTAGARPAAALRVGAGTAIPGGCGHGGPTPGCRR